MSDYGCPIRDNVKLEPAQAEALRLVLISCRRLVENVEETNAALPWSVAQRVEALNGDVNCALRRLMERIDGSKLVPAEVRP